MSGISEGRIREALLYDSLGAGVVACNTCERHCVVAPGECGTCKTRKNIQGGLCTLVYGDLTALSANPIEKKPLFHFWPGSRALTTGTWSCNFDCPWCQNETVSKHPENVGKGGYTSAEDFVREIEKYGLQGSSISFNEPTLLLEYSLDVFDLARRKGYYNTYVTNGYMTGDALRLLIEHGLDAMNVDIKGDAKVVKAHCKADVEMVWRNARLAKEQGVWVEVTTLVIPDVNDDEECLSGIAARIGDELGEETPWHVTRYYPACRFTRPATPVDRLERACEIGREKGLEYVYVGNVPGHEYQNTHCPSCGELLIERDVFDIMQYRLGADGSCPGCQRAIPIVGEFVRRR